jgi:hypothetical protein
MPGPTIQDILDRLDALDLKLAGVGIKQDGHTTGDNSGIQSSGENWNFQGFITTDEYTITSVRLKMYRAGNPGIVTASIRAADGEGEPTGPDLCSGTIDGNTFTTSISGEWYRVPFNVGTLLPNASQYTIVVRAVAGDVSNYIKWRANSGGGYSGGVSGISTNSGETWTDFQATDHVFETYSSPGLSNVHTVTEEVNLKLPEAVTG